MNSIITPQQSAFIGGRQIQDNLVIVQEAFNALKKRGRIGRDHLSVKLDMNKAFDRVEWIFLEKALLAYGFHQSWVKLVMKLVTGVTYRYKINGVCGEKLKPERGLRQATLSHLTCSYWLWTSFLT